MSSLGRLVCMCVRVCLCLSSTKHKGHWFPQKKLRKEKISESKEKNEKFVFATTQ